VTSFKSLAALAVLSVTAAMPAFSRDAHSNRGCVERYVITGGCRTSSFLINSSHRGMQMMILFPLMTTWMWFQILAASPLPAAGRSPRMRATTTFLRHM